MKYEPSATTPRASSASKRRRWLGALLAAVAVASGCGGGDPVAGVGTGGTGAFAVGPITGLGSIVVNGVRYDDSGATVVDADGRAGVVGTGTSPLAVGMVVEVSGRVDDGGATGTATRVVYVAEIKGPVTAVDAAAGTFDVFGLRVRTNAATVYADFAGVAALAAGHVVEVYGLPDPGGRVLATRVERKATSVAAYAASGGVFRLRGTAQAVAGTGSALRFSVAGVVVATDASTQVDGAVVDGAFVRLRLDALALGDGSYHAQRVQSRARAFDDAAAGGKAEIEGYVGGFAGPASEFTVGGWRVRLAAQVRYDNGVAADLGDGVRVEVEGRVSDGVLVADEVEFKARDDDEDERSGREFEFKGTASCIDCGAAEGRFTLRGATIAYDAATRFEGVGAATLDGRRVAVKGVAEVGAQGTVYRATRIERDD